MIETNVHSVYCSIDLEWQAGCTFPVGELTQNREAAEKMELTLLTNGHFFTTSFLSTQGKEEPSLDLRECRGAQEFVDAKHGT